MSTSKSPEELQEEQREKKASQKRADLSKFLERKFIEFQNERGIRARIKDFADMVDLHPATMGQLMNGERLPDMKNLAKLGRKWPEVYRIMEVEIPEDLSPLSKQILQDFYDLDDDGQQEALAFLRKLKGKRAETHVNDNHHALGSA